MICYCKDGISILLRDMILIRVLVLTIAKGEGKAVVSIGTSHS